VRVPDQNKRIPAGCAGYSRDSEGLYARCTTVMAGRWCDDRRSRQSDHNAHGPRRLWGGSLAPGHDRAFALPSLMGAFPLPTRATTGAGIGIGKSAASAASPSQLGPTTFHKIGVHHD